MITVRSDTAVVFHCVIVGGGGTDPKKQNSAQKNQSGAVLQLGLGDK